MANICFYDSDQTIDPDFVDQILATINTDKFGGLLEIAPMQKGWGWKISINDFEFDLWRIDGTKLEWKNQLDCLAVWTLNTITARLVRTLDPNGYMMDEGLGDEQIKPEFDQKFPKPSDWAKILFGETILVDAYNTNFPELMRVVEQPSSS